MSALFWPNTTCPTPRRTLFKTRHSAGKWKTKWAAALPCVEIDGRMLADVSGEEVERYLVENKLVEASDAATDVPTNAPCANEQHEGVVKLNL